MAKRRTKGKRKQRRPARMSKSSLRKMIKDVGETKLIKDIAVSPFVVNAPYMLVTPYQHVDSTATPAVNWPVYNDATNLHGREWIKVGSQYNQRIGRRVSIKGSTVELRASIVSGAATGNPDYPLYCKLRVIHGWVKSGYDHLNDVQMDMGGGNMYDEIPYSKYKILSDRVILRQAHPSIAIGQVMTSTTLPGKQTAVYRPLHFKFRWGGGPMTFSDSLQSPTQIGHGSTYTGWCPFFIICNPDHGAADNNLNLNIEFIKRVISYKDA